MEDYLAYYILAVVFIWYCRSTYKKFKGETGRGGCSGGCGGCNTKNDSCDGDAKRYDGKLEKLNQDDIII